jgi:cyclophilin family peptidyl-prolyl cis-trans isomerase
VPAVRRLIALAALVALAGCGSSNDKKTTSTATTGTGSAAATKVGCQKVAEPRPKPDGELDRPSLKIDASKRWTATLQTNCGTVRMSLDVKQQPKTVASFVYLAKRGFFDGLTFHRIARSPDGSDFVVQGGDPTGSGQGGPGYSVTERPPSNAHYSRGTVAMAKTEVEAPGTSGSQFFIVTAEDAGLPPDYAVLGHVTGDDAAVRRMAAVPSDPNTGRPNTPVVMSKVTVASR